MKKFLPAVLLFFIISLQLTSSVSAQVTPTDTPVPTAGVTTTPVPTLPGIGLGVPTITPYLPTAGPTSALPTPPDDTWVADSEVTFVGKTGARSGKFLDWALQRYEWSYVDPGKSNPLLPFWATIRNIIYVFSVLFVLITAFILIVTRGRSLTITRFIPRFFAVLLLVTFSFSIVQFIYQISDAIMGFFIRNKAGAIISQKDLLYVGFDYETFIGFRKTGFLNDESAFITLLLTKLTALTYYVMTGLLLVRKVILWFFIVISPVFPVLLLYYPVRNTAKIWVGEFFRWLLYGPLFALFLSGLVNLWSTTIPLKFDYTAPGRIVGTDIMYPTVVNILLGGPGQSISIMNSVNLPDTFALYTIALIMLWVATLLPFVLLQIFLDYLRSFDFSNNWAVRQIANSGANFFNKPIVPAPGSPPPPSQPAGKARSLPFMNKTMNIPQINQKPAGMAKEIPTGAAERQMSSASYKPSQPLQTRAQILQLTSLSVPTMRDIARFETAQLSRSSVKQSEATRIQQTLERISQPQLVSQPIERARYAQLKEKLVRESRTGNTVATTILSAANASTRQMSSREVTRTSQVLEKISNTSSLKEKLVSESKVGNPVAASVLSAVQKLSSASTTQKEKTTIVNSLKEMLTRESKEGNSVASTILSQITSESYVSQVKDMLTQLSNPASVTSATEHEQITSLKESLTQASQQGNTLATTILSAADTVNQNQVTSMQQTLQSLANPATITSTTEKERVTQLKEKLEVESKQGNTLATTILSATEKLQTATSTQEKETIVTTLRDQLVKESQQGNTLATTVLSQVDKQTAERQTTKLTEVLQSLSNPSIIPSASDKERMTQIKDQLVKESQQGNTLATTILSTMQSVSATKEAKEKQETMVSQLKDQLVKESQQGNTLATALLAASGGDETMDTQKISEKLKEEKAKGNPLADTILGMFQTQQQVTQAGLEGISTNLPMANKVQQVSLEDYEAVKKMWQENYHNMEVPQSISNNSRDRKEWVQDDISKMTDTINLLTSTDQEKVQEGMKQVSDILPFLLIGGFSQQEIVTYLKAKLEAAKTTQEELSKVEEDEDTMISVETRKATASKHMTATTEDSFTSSFSETAEGEPESELSRTPHNIITNRRYDKTVILQPQIKTDVLQLSNLTLPTIHDIVKYETNMLATKGQQPAEVSQIVETLQKIANPEKETDTTNREQYTSLKEKLVKESKQGNPVAASILQAATTSTSSQTTTLQTIIQQIARPEIVTNLAQQATYQQIQKEVAAESKKGNQLAQAILDTEQNTSPQNVGKLQQKLSAAKEKGDHLATNILGLADKVQTQTPAVLPTQNKIQQVSLDDYEAVRSMWEENYRQMDVPTSINGEQKSRKDWIQDDVAQVSQAVDLLTSADPQKVQEGMKMVSQILPFLLIGGFSQQEVVAYLKAKLAAGKSALSQVQQEAEKEENLVSVDIKQATIPHAMTASFEEQAIPEESGTVLEHVRAQVPAMTSKPIILQPQAKTDLLQLSNISVPTIHDIVNYEKTLLTSKDQSSDVSKVYNALQKIANPQKESNTTEREQYSTLKEELVSESKQGNPVATSVLTAAQHVLTSPVALPIESVHMQTIFEKIANPTIIPNAQEREHYVQLQNALITESQGGNALASTILSTISTLSQSETTMIRDTLQYIANPQAAKGSEHQQVAQLKEKLLTESQQGNSLATHVLSVAQAFSESALSNETQIALADLLKEKLLEEKEQGNPLITEVLSVTNISAKTTAPELNAVLKRLLNPGAIESTPEREKYTHLKERMEKESKQGSKSATSILSLITTIVKAVVTEEGRMAIADMIREKLVKEKEKGNLLAAALLALTPATPDDQVEKLKEQLLQAKLAGDPLAIALIDMFLQSTGQTEMLPSQNRVQQVSLEDYEAVRSMWEENYRDIEVPVGRDGVQRERRAWLIEEVAHITEAIDLLSSKDPEKVKQGMRLVSQILPFLLIGGFSLEEVVAYLKAKLAAAKAVLQELDKANPQEDVELATQKKQEEKTMSVHEDALQEPEIVKASDQKDNTPKK